MLVIPVFEALVQTDSQVAVIARVIQLSVAPVFLLSGVGAMLAVLTNRLARIVDRGRFLESQLATAAEHRHDELHRNLLTLSRRAKLANIAISLCTVCALLVCTVIAALFFGAFLELDVSMMVALLFVLAMLALIGGLVLFLREIFIATSNLRIGPRH